MAREAIVSKCEVRPPATHIPLKTRSFQIPRIRLAYLASEEYLRTFWWFAATVPIFGILMIIFGHGLLQIIGLSALLWPISIPARGILSSTKATSLFTNGCFAAIDEEFLTFYDTSSRTKPLRWQLPLIRVRDVVERHEFYVVRMRKLDIVAIPISAFESEADRAAFVRTIAHAIEARYAEQ